MEIDFSTLPDGVPPKTFGPGPAIQWGTPPDNPGSRLRVVDGMLTNSPESTDGVAGYYTTSNLGASIKEIGAYWSFWPRNGGGDDGAMALLVSQNGKGPPLPVHLVITPTEWWFGVWPPGEKSRLDVIRQGRFVTPLAVDRTATLYTSVRLGGERAQVSLPDGTFETIRDRRIAKWSGSYATFEVFAKNGTSDPAVGFSRIWAVA
ncbi:hypothetical protein ACWDTD_19950 [Gordonia sp. NPDC003425]